MVAAGFAPWRVRPYRVRSNSVGANLPWGETRMILSYINAGQIIRFKGLTPKICKLNCPFYLAIVATSEVMPWPYHLNRRFKNMTMKAGTRQDKARHTTKNRKIDKIIEGRYKLNSTLIYKTNISMSVVYQRYVNILLTLKDNQSHLPRSLSVHVIQQNTNISLHTPLAAAILAIIWMASRMKNLPSPPTTRVHPALLVSGIESKIHCTKFSV